MPKTTITNIVNASIITAFTLAAALIWKDVIMGIIEVFVQGENRLLYQFVAAVIATALVAIVIITILKTEREAEIVIEKFNHPKK